MRVISLGSGSSGNAVLVEAGPQGRTKLLVDAGFSGRVLSERLRQVGVHPTQLRGVLITHEHSDHINGVEVLSKKYDLPVYITHKTYNSSGLQIDPSRLLPFKQDQPVEIGQITVILIAFMLVGIWFGKKSWYHARIVVPASVIIAMIALFWTIERTAASLHTLQ